MKFEIPAHVAIIMDGNGRWAERRGLGRSEGHRAGTENVRRVTRSLAERGVEVLTIYAFSTENWDRPRYEVRALMEMLGRSIKSETPHLHAEGVRIRHLGRLDRLPESLRLAINDSIELTRHNEGITLCVAFDYGGREEILEATRRLISSAASISPRFDVTSPRTTFLPSGIKLRGAKSPERSSSYSRKKLSTLTTGNIDWANLEYPPDTIQELRAFPLQRCIARWVSGRRTLTHSFRRFAYVSISVLGSSPIFSRFFRSFWVLVRVSL